VLCCQAQAAVLHPELRLPWLLLPRLQRLVLLLWLLRAGSRLRIPLLHRLLLRVLRLLRLLLLLRQRLLRLLQVTLPRLLPWLLLLRDRILPGLPRPLWQPVRLPLRLLLLLRPRLPLRLVLLLHLLRRRLLLGRGCRKCRRCSRRCSVAVAIVAA
jgi:hypothetical protein